MQVLDFNQFMWNKKAETLQGTSKNFERHMFPSEFGVRSPWTGKIATFKAMTQDDILFDHDFWDGEFCGYRPAEKLKGITALWLSHE
jgi:hypothetical protein